jgi:hypothetical protein
VGRKWGHFLEEKKWGKCVNVFNAVKGLIFLEIRSRSSPSADNIISDSFV